MHFIAAMAFAVTAPAAATPADWVAANRVKILNEYMELLALPNDARNLPDIRCNADHIVAMMQKRGLKPRLLESADGKAPPMIYGEWLVPGAKRTYVFYAHYDGQQVNSADWKVTKPFQPQLFSEDATKGGKPIAVPAAGQAVDPNWRVYARSASDDKAGVMAVLAAVDALKAAGKRPSFNVKIVFEGEEEVGSPHLSHLLRRHKAQLASDGWVIVDGPAAQLGSRQLLLGVRGIVMAELTVYGPTRGLHSGHYGNWAPNPAMMLAKLLASMKDDSGRVTIDGFYDDVVPLTPAERAALAAIPSPDAMLKRELGLGSTEGGGAKLAELIQQPSLNIDGMRSADVGEKARNVVPTTAVATLDLRLVLGNTPARQLDKLRQHIRSQGYELFDREPTVAERIRFPKVAKLTSEVGYPSERTSIDHPLARGLAEALARSGPVVLMPSGGGSVPLSLVRQELGAGTPSLGLWNYDNNQHSEDENIRLGYLWAGIVSVADAMTMK